MNGKMDGNKRRENEWKIDENKRRENERKRMEIKWEEKGQRIDGNIYPLK